MSLFCKPPVSLLRLLGVVGMVAPLLAGCGSAPKTDSQAVQAAEPSPRTVDLFYVTDRDAHPSGRDDFGPERGKVSYGIASVGIPPNHEIGRQEAPSVFRFEWSADERKHIALQHVPLWVAVTHLPER